jgi:tRNA A22 N-methylase
MISIQKCREILGDKSAHLSDEQVLSLRDSLYSILNLIFDSMAKKEAQNVE